MTKLALYAAVGVAIFGGLFAFIQYQRSIGGEAERLEQVKANAQFHVRSHKGAVDFDTCDRAGGLYDFRRGTCKLQ